MHTNQPIHSPDNMWTPFNTATLCQAKNAIITGGPHYLEFLFRKISKFLYKSGHIYRPDILTVDIFSGIYCNSQRLCFSSPCFCSMKTLHWKHIRHHLTYPWMLYPFGSRVHICKGIWIFCYIKTPDSASHRLL